MVVQIPSYDKSIANHNHNLDWDVAFTPVAELIYDQITTVIGPPIRRGGSWLGPTVDVIWQHAVYRNPCSHLLLYPDNFTECRTIGHIIIGTKLRRNRALSMYNDDDDSWFFLDATSYFGQTASERLSM